MPIYCPEKSGALKELFQLDQPDLDFGLYRVIHAKSAEVSQFVDQDLLPQVKEAFALYRSADRAELQKQLSKVIADVEAAGMNPADSPKVVSLRARLASDAVDIGTLESESYEHLYCFFRRYYSEGDFLAKRVYKPGVYAIPYEGEEVTLHWSNKDQYYIKTSEYLRDYAFRLRPHDDRNPMRVHFRLVDATEGEHGNVKAAEGKGRVFILATTRESGHDFIAEDDGEQGKELVIRFEYRPATLTDWPEDERSGKNRAPIQTDLSVLAVKCVLAVADGVSAPWIAELAKPHVMASGERADYSRLEAHLRRYTARNTFDYFIHKDLGSFLRRELDFYIKNEIMHLDDIENESTPRVEQYLSKIKVIRKIAGKIIDFLAQLEDFQKKLWLKKPFVVETQYCIAVGCIPEAFYAEICANKAQHEEWVKLLAIDEIKGDVITPGYSKNLNPEFLKSHPTLVVDTRYFESGFTERLLEVAESVDEQMDGILLHGDNFQALSLLQDRYAKCISAIQIDPPYNTGGDGFVYKDGFQDSSWLASMQDRLDLSLNLLSDTGSVSITIDRHEDSRLRLLCDRVYGTKNFVANIAWQKLYTIKNSAKYLSEMWDSVLIYAKNKDNWRPLRLERSDEQEEMYGNLDDDPKGPWISNALQARNYYSAGTYSIKCPGGRFIEKPPGGTYWRTDEASFWKLNRAGRVWWGQDKNAFPRIKKYLKEMSAGVVSADFWLHQFAGTNAESKIETRNLLGDEVAGLTPKPVKLLRRLIEMTCDPSGLVLDFFAGSGTTGNAVIDLNRGSLEDRKFILVELGDYFDTVLLPRIKKATFTVEWKNGKPKRLATPEEAERSPRIVKVVRLESYEDTLNNLQFRRTENQRLQLENAEAQGADGFREQYTLRYLLNVETRGSQSLLNVQAFTDPTAYKLKVKRPGSDESREVNVDLLETFNWLIGLTVRHIAAPRAFSAAFERDGEKRLRLKGRLKEAADGPYWFRTVTGTTPDGRRTLVIWRKLSGEPEQENLVLDEWFTRQGYSAKDSEFDLIYVNSGNNLENLKTSDDLWKVQLIEEDFHRLMFEIEGA